ncbi:ABC-type spermidine/putrescine transport system, permease component I [Paenibacillus sp. yr247]|uniref:ABC transporter permease n=1 Tax=Paenibacillus sp. yr247 TaxID=1761880 RepID=UPI00088BAA82|nr:ABC transporter permease subunit [Paenibacillus sp. yr247]SDN71715.1 ABC-type spermidine/putrescine transport system, permease component I [Paenibacillus sp. yr247]
MNKNVKQGIFGLSLVIPSFLLLCFVVIAPIILAINESFRDDNGNYTLQYYIKLFTDKGMSANILFTLKLTIISVIAVVLIGYALAIYMRFSTGRIVNGIKKMYMIPMFVPSVIASYGIINMYGNHGWLSRLLLPLGVESIPKIIFDYKGIILANLWFNIPFTTMLLASALSGIPNALIESAKDIGAGRMQIFFKLIVPLTYRTMLVAITFSFMGIIGGFTAPFLIGPNSPQVLGVAMRQVFSVYQETQLASATAVFMFVLCSFMGYFYIRTMIKDDKVSSH